MFVRPTSGRHDHGHHGRKKHVHEPPARGGGCNAFRAPQTHCRHHSSEELQPVFHMGIPCFPQSYVGPPYVPSLGGTVAHQTGRCMMHRNRRTEAMVLTCKLDMRTVPLATCEVCIHAHLAGLHVIPTASQAPANSRRIMAESSNNSVNMYTSSA